MARYTKIPEVDFAGALSKALSPIIGGISSKAKETVLDNKELLADMSLKAFKEAREQLSKGENSCLSSYSSLGRVNSALNSVKSSLSAVSNITGTLRTSIQALEAPIEALNAAIQIIKLIPIPQMYLVVSITTVFSDTLEMLAEIVAQTKEMIDSATGVLDTLDGTILPISDTLTGVMQTLSTLEADQSLHCALSEASQNDLDTLGRLGIFDSNGDSIFNKLGQDPLDDGCVSFGTSNPSKESLQKLGYMLSSGQTTLKQYNDEHGTNIQQLQSITYSGNEIGIEDGTTILISSEEDIASLLQFELSGLSNATYLSEVVRDAIKGVLGTYSNAGTGKNSVDANNGDSEYYRSSLGDLYLLEVVVDSTSPKLAVRHYAQAKSMDGVVVLTGNSSFTLNSKTLLEELKVQLSQIVG